MSPDPEPRRKLGDRPDFEEWTAEIMGALGIRGRNNGHEPAAGDGADGATASSSAENAPRGLWRRLRAGRR